MTPHRHHHHHVYQELCGEVARVLFLVVWTCTRPRRLGVNVEVLYAMLHDQTALEEIFNHPAMASAEWAADLPELLAHFQELAGKAEVSHGEQVESHCSFLT